ncbi:hypothetical protein H4R34_002837 [Dimargaris verticillata]|uniref:Uncharacterized protein n=1 Tax=Dimargaris verticillata TaxID=2761393 RepID=A0A9W8B7E7_9FUNG|nr:hypothetical protein H4R34_002837 [Dimargaris verticillata]
MVAFFAKAVAGLFPGHRRQPHSNADAGPACALNVYRTVSHTPSMPRSARRGSVDTEAVDVAPTADEVAQAIAEYHADIQERKRRIVYRRVAVLVLATAIYGIMLVYTLVSQGNKTSYLVGFGILLVIFYLIVFLSIRREIKRLEYELFTFQESFDPSHQPVTVIANRFDMARRATAPLNDAILPPPPPCYAEAQLQPPAYSPKPMNETQLPPMTDTGHYSPPLTPQSLLSVGVERDTISFQVPSPTATRSQPLSSSNLPPAP